MHNEYDQMHMRWVKCYDEIQVERMMTHILPTNCTLLSYKKRVVCVRDHLIYNNSDEIGQGFSILEILA